MVDRVRASAKLQRDDSRCQRRMELYSKARGVDVSEFADLSVVAFDSALTSLEVDTQKSLAILKRAFVQDTSHIVSFLRHKSALHFVVGRLISSEPYEQLEALECCCNASLGDPKSCSLVANAGAIYIIQIVHGTNMNLIKVALTTLGNLSISNENVCRLLYEQGMLPAILAAIKVEETRELAVKTLCQFTYFYLPRLSDEEVVQCIDSTASFFSNHSDVQWLMGQLSAREAARLRLSDHQIPACAAKLICSCRSITSENVRSITALIRLLGNCASQIPFSGDLSPFAITVSASKFPHVRKEFSWMMSRVQNDCVVAMEA